MATPTPNSGSTTVHDLISSGSYPNNDSQRIWHPAEDTFLLNLTDNYDIRGSYNNNPPPPPAKPYPELSWRHIACCMTEFSKRMVPGEGQHGSKAGLAERVYGADEVMARYAELWRRKGVAVGGGKFV